MPTGLATCRRFCRETLAAGAAFHDFSSIDRFNGDPRGFWDGAHVDEANADRMTTLLLDGYHALQ